MKLPENVRAYFQQQGKIGAAKRQETLSPERRIEIARKAAQTRWKKKAAKSSSKKGTK
jgi:hypothetical protein